jgi:hypothetical protein
MYNKLLIAAFATAFSINSFAAEAPDYTFLPHAEAEHCRTHKTEICQSIAIFHTTVRQLLEKSDNNDDRIAILKEHEDQRDTLKETLQKEILEFATQKAKSILEATTQEVTEAAKDIAAELNVTAKPQE